jgi:Matrixin
MFDINMPYVPPQDTPIIMSQVNTTQIASAGPIISKKFEKIFKEGCLDVNNAPGASESAFNQFPLLPEVLDHLGYKMSGGYYNVPPDIFAQIKSYVVEAPKHGKVTLTSAKHHVWAYESTPDYLGKDRVSFAIEVNGKRFKIVLDLAVVAGVNENDDPACIKMFKLGIDNLPSGVLGEVQGQGTSAKLTLDTNAAGHGWFVDTTPDDNSEFLATSNPNVWIARAGSAADGKMDMLSVLLHEYGHVLGLDHSDGNDDAMAVVLQPGVRKLWSETDLAKLNEIKYLQSTQSGQLPVDFPADYPNNGLPPGQTRASTPVARRPRRDTDVNIDLLSDAKIEALNAINPTLTGGDLLSPQGWETTGAVNIANGHATLAETARSQSRLTQGFVLSSQDRYLSFTVEGLQMTDSTVGPDDAFEVALLNANTRAALTSTVALTRSDALLNIQANGTERRSGAQAATVASTEDVLFSAFGHAEN